MLNYTTPPDDGDHGYVDASDDSSSYSTPGASYYSISALGANNYVSPFMTRTLYEPSYSDDSLYTNKGFSLYNAAPDDDDLPEPVLLEDEPEESDLDTVKKFIKSTGHDDIREALFQFIQADPSGPEKFLQFLNKNSISGTRRMSRSEDWTKVDGFQGRNWSEEYCQLIIDRKTKQMKTTEWQTKMYSLSSDFFHASSLYGEIIVSELTVPSSLKSIQPVNVGGIAGGDKYIVDNILFKFAVDSPIGDKDSTFMYGGVFQRNDLAMKAAGIEMRNMQTAMALSEQSLMMPLMCVIDYKGHRLIASSIIPINQNTLVYGSANGGRTVQKSDPKLNEMMKSLGEKLNLQEHRVGTRITGKDLYMPGDIEVHRGLDDRYYLLDMARMMPPEAPMRGEDGKIPPETYRRIFYQTLRPELVCRYEKPLSSDAFSAWAHTDRNKAVHDQAVQDCTDFLRNTLIPRFSKALETEQLENAGYIPATKEEWMSTEGGCIPALLDHTQISPVVHFYGINVRHLGLIRSHTTSDKYRDFLLAQIVARAMKNVMRADMREVMRTNKGSPTDIPLRDLVLNTYRKIRPFGHRVDSDALRRESKAYWDNIFTVAKEQFPGTFTKEEEAEIDRRGLHFFLRLRVDFRVILYLFFTLAQIRLSTSAMNQLLKATVSDNVCHMSEFHLVRSDVEQFTPRIRKPFTASVASSLLLAGEAEQESLAPSNAARLMEMSTSLMLHAHTSVPICPHVNSLLGELFRKRAKLLEDVKEILVSNFTALRHMEMALPFADIMETCVDLQASFLNLLDETEALCKQHSVCQSFFAGVRHRTSNCRNRNRLLLSDFEQTRFPSLKGEDTNGATYTVQPVGLGD